MANKKLTLQVQAKVQVQSKAQGKVQAQIYNKWLDYEFKLKNRILTKIILKKSLTKLWDEQIKNLYKDKIILIQFKIKSGNDLFRSIYYVQNIKKSNFKELDEIFYEFWDTKSKNYKSLKLNSIIFTYKILSLVRLQS